MTRAVAFAAAMLSLSAAWLPAGAQPQGPVRTVGIIAHGAPISFEDGLRELGWVEGKNVRFERRVHSDDRKISQAAAELVRMHVDVIFAGNAAATRAAVQATKPIPIVTVSADPVSTGVASSLARPGANVTGLAFTQLTGKRLEILVQALPATRRVALLTNPKNPNAAMFRREAEAAAQATGITLTVFEVSAPEQIAEVVGTVARARPDGFAVTGDPMFWAAGQAFIEQAARHRLPAMWDHRLWVEAGGLMSYGADPSLLYRRAATYADRILRGAKPAELPVEQPTNFELAINQKTARALGITIAPPVLLRADRIVE
jgi:ABC-type uncharacterized transport system substrate-binding protein